MAGLGETLRGLANGRHGGRQAGGGRLRETTSFGANPGALRMLSYTPSGLPEGSPLVVLLHGCTQDAEVHAAASGWLNLADRLNLAVLAPEQTAAGNPNRCFNWFQPGDTTRGQGEVASIHAMVVHMLAEHRLDPSRVFVSGLSAGGAMAAAMLATYPEVFAGGAIIAGLPYGVAQTMPEALAAMRGVAELSTADLTGRVAGAAPQPVRWPRVSIWHGDRDHTVHGSAADASARQWSRVHGLAPAPDSVETYPGRTRAVWLSPDGEALVEQHTVGGLGHGVPLATRGEGAHGFTAPFMLEAGVSSALVTARFWDLAPRGSEEPALASSPPPHVASKPELALGESVLTSTAPHVPAGVQEVIARALGAAGLLR